MNTAIIDALPDPVLMFEPDSMALKWMNRAAENWLRISLANRLGTPLAEIAPGFDGLSPAVLSIAKTGKTIRGRDLHIHPLGGKASDWSYLVFPSEPNVVVLLSPQLKNNGQSGDQPQGQAVSMLGRMLAHELKNPLAGIYGAAQLLESGLSQAADIEITDLIKSEVGRIGRLADKMESFGDSDAANFEHFNVHTVLRKAYLLFQNTDSANIKITEIYDPSLPDVYGNADQLMQVVVNLLANALDAVGAVRGNGGGRIYIQTVYRAGMHKKNAAGDRYALPVEIRVIDNGNGIPADLKGRVFQPFVTAKANGHGLGLALVAKIINEHGGLVEFTSEPGKTVFSVLLPTKQYFNT